MATLAFAFFAQDCLAQTMAERRAFVAADRCDVEEILGAVAKSSKRMDRYVVLALREDQGRYAQCLLGSGKGDSESLCEVASGAFSFEQAPIVATPERVAALKGLGFKIRNGSNYYRTVRVTKGDIRPLADLLLSALSVAFGAEVGTPVLATASLAHADRREVRAIKSCAPMS